MTYRPALLIPCALAAAAPAIGQTPDWSKGKPVTIAMTDQGFAPAAVTLKSGASYVLHIVNRSDRAHNLSAKTFFDLALVDPRDQAWVAKDSVDLNAHGSATIHIVAPTTPGAKYAFRSTRIEDAGSKMKGAIYVR